LGTPPLLGGTHTYTTRSAPDSARETSPFLDFRLSRGVTWLEPTLHVDLTYRELMEGRLRDPLYRGPRGKAIIARPLARVGVDP